MSSRQASGNVHVRRGRGLFDRPQLLGVAPALLHKHTIAEGGRPISRAKTFACPRVLFLMLPLCVAGEPAKAMPSAAARHTDSRIKRLSATKGRIIFVPFSRYFRSAKRVGRTARCNGCSTCKGTGKDCANMAWSPKAAASARASPRVRERLDRRSKWHFSAGRSAPSSTRAAHPVPRRHGGDGRAVPPSPHCASS